MATSSSSAPTSSVQHVTKASSDELLRKFADDADDEAGGPSAPSLPARHQLLLLREPVRRKRSRRVLSGLVARELAAGSETHQLRRTRRRSGGPADWNALLPAPAARRRSSSLLRRMGIGRSGALGPGFVLVALEKTWRRTVEGASRILVERHCNKHVQLISDIV